MTLVECTLFHKLSSTRILTVARSTSLEINHKSFDIVKKSQAGGGVAVKIEHAVYQSAKMFGRHFDDKDELYSHITRQSIDVLKASFKQDVSNEEWLLIKALKPVCYTICSSRTHTSDMSDIAPEHPVEKNDCYEVARLSRRSTSTCFSSLQRLYRRKFCMHAMYL